MNNMVNASKIPSNKKFGYFISLAIVLISAYFYQKFSFPLILWIVALTFFLCATFAPKVLWPLNKIWFKLGQLLGRVMSPIVLGVIYYFIITPVALVGRLFERDPLLLKRRTISTYWVKKDKIEADMFKNQF